MAQADQTAADSQPTGSGGCLCGGVTYEVIGPLRPVFNCHCYRCRQTSGHHVAATGCAPEDLVVADSGSLAWYEPVEGVFYGFCSSCGSSLFFRTDEGALTNISIMAGTLTQPTGLETSADWWAAEAADYHQLRSDTTHYPYDG